MKGREGSRRKAPQTDCCNYNSTQDSSTTIYEPRPSLIKNKWINRQVNIWTAASSRWHENTRTVHTCQTLLRKNNSFCHNQSNHPPHRPHSSSTTTTPSSRGRKITRGAQNQKAKHSTIFYLLQQQHQTNGQIMVRPSLSLHACMPNRQKRRQRRWGGPGHTPDNHAACMQGRGVVRVGVGVGVARREGWHFTFSINIIFIIWLIEHTHTTTNQPTNHHVARAKEERFYDVSSLWCQAGHNTHIYMTLSLSSSSLGMLYHQ